MKKKNYDTTMVTCAAIMFVLGFALMIWSAISLSWLRLLIGVIFILFSQGYAYSAKSGK